MRGAAAIVLLTCAERLQAEDWKTLGTEQLLKIAGKLVSDNTPDARNAAKKIIVLLKTAYAKQVRLAAFASFAGLYDFADVLLKSGALPLFGLRHQKHVRLSR